MTILIIVESPKKAMTIQKFLGSGYIVKASVGHIRELDKKAHHFGIEIDNGFQPHYTISKLKAANVKILRDVYKSCSEVILASDEDREGEAIAWHVADVLKLKSPKRIVFHEITKSAIEKALKSPRTINMDIVHSQEARCILDILVGFELSPILWSYIRGELSAGRVQSIATRLIVDREKEIQKFQAAPYFSVNAKFDNGLYTLLNKHIDNKDITLKFLEACKSAKFIVADIDKKQQKRNPSAPFITSSLQQEVGKKLRMSAKHIMALAQKLYEGGHITYHRTDCTILSEQILADIKKYITGTYGENYVHMRQYKSKAKNAQEAHEAIRPTNINVLSIADATDDENRLYQMIWKRTVASQMKACEVDVYHITIDISNQPDYKFIGKAEEITFDGYLRVYNYKEESDSDDEKEGVVDNLKLIKSLKVGTELKYVEINAKETYTKPPMRYTEPTLNKKMETLGIGRPSTYASLVSKIQERGYVEFKSVKGKQVDTLCLSLVKNVIKESVVKTTLDSDKNKLIPTDIGIQTTDFLIEHFKNILDYDFTSKMEEELDDIYNGKKVWNKVVEEFYATFHPIVAKLSAEKPDDKRMEKKRVIGVNTDGVEMFVYQARYGPLLVVGDKKYKLHEGQSVDTFTESDAKTLMENSYPRTIGEHNGKPVVMKDGKFGVYLEYGGKNYNLKNKDNIDDFTMEMAKELIDNKSLGDYNGKPINVKDGQYGTYLEYGGKNYNLPKDNTAELTLESAIQIIDEKDKKLIKNINATVKIMNGEYGPYISFGAKKFVGIPKDRDPMTLTLQDCKNLEEIDKIKKANFKKAGFVKKTGFTKK